MQERSDISGRQRLRRLKFFSRAIAAFLFLIFILIGVPATTTGLPVDAARLPAGLDPWIQTYPLRITETLKALKGGVEHYSGGRYTSALEALPDENAAKATAIGDYVLLYRAKSCLMMERNKEALNALRLLESQYPDSSLVRDALLGKCQALLKLQDQGTILSALSSPNLETGADILYYQARALHEAGEKEKAVDRYLQIYSLYPGSSYSPLAEKYLLSLSPGALTGARNYIFRLQRAENLLKIGEVRKARALLLNLGRVSSPDSLSFEKRHLLFAEAEYHLGNAAAALSSLGKVTAADRSMHAKAIYLEGACCRRLNREQAFLALRDKALKLYPRSPYTEELLYSVATYFDVNFEQARARESYKAIHDSFPHGRYAERALWKLALFSYLEARYEDAVRGFWNYVLDHPNPVAAGSAAYWMGRCYEKTGDFERARHLYLRVQALANNSYYGQRAQEAEASLPKSRNGTAAFITGIDFGQVIKMFDEIQPAPISIQEAEAGASRIIERAGQLATAGLTDLALSEVRWGIRRYPKSESALCYVMSRIYESRKDYVGVIACLRKVFSDYNTLPLASLPEEIWQLLFPVRHWTIISEQAARAGVEPSLILGIIRQESAFAEKARSSANALGLMQILPSTARKMARQGRAGRYSVKKLFQADTNIALGTRHLASLLQLYGKEELALAAYDAGETRVDRWLNEFGKADMAEFVERIPFSETRSYIKQVLSNKAHYSLRSQLPVSAAH